MKKEELHGCGCGFDKDITEIATHYTGKTGKEYPIDEYQNWGTGETYLNKKDLPLDEYPYSIKYHYDFVWAFCRKGALCEKKKKEDIILLETYMWGFNDALDDRVREISDSDPLLSNAYKLGRIDGIVGDDVTSLDYQTNEQILNRIKNKI